MTNNKLNDTQVKHLAVEFWRKVPIDGTPASQSFLLDFVYAHGKQILGEETIELEESEIKLSHKEILALAQDFWVKSPEIYPTVTDTMIGFVRLHGRTVLLSDSGNIELAREFWEKPRPNDWKISRAMVDFVYAHGKAILGL
jgi:hypothetical protein